MTIPSTVRPAITHPVWLAITWRRRSGHAVPTAAGRARSMVTVPTDTVSVVMAANVTSAIERASSWKSAMPTAWPTTVTPTAMLDARPPAVTQFSAASTRARPNIAIAPT